MIEHHYIKKESSERLHCE